MPLLYLPRLHCANSEEVIMLISLGLITHRTCCVSLKFVRMALSKSKESLNFPSSMNTPKCDKMSFCSKKESKWITLLVEADIKRG